MHWVVQSNLINPACREDLVAAILQTGAEVTQATMVPFANQLAEPVAPMHGPVFVYGSTGMGQVARQHGWVPGY